MNADLLHSARQLIDAGRACYDGHPEAERLARAGERLGEPLRVAIAGKVKAGKSTLLNALVGEQLAPTDEGECTRIVTWYRDGHTYEVRAELVAGGSRQLRFTRADGAVDIDMGDLAPEQVDRLLVTWPSSALRAVTLIDTPGIGSLTTSLSERMARFVAADEEAAPADAVLYLMRHLHANDVSFLESFHDVEVSRASPVNAIAVLSRADEIGVGRLDAMASARRIAQRYRDLPKVRSLVQTVVPVAGLLAETAATLTEDEFRWLRPLGGLAPADLERLLVSTDRFITSTPELGLTELERHHLLDRFGIFGVRVAATLMRRDVTSSATDLARELIKRSGLIEVRELLTSLFADRADLLKARSALLTLDDVIRVHPVPGSNALAARLEETIAGAHPFNELRVLSAIRAGWIEGRAEHMTELERLLGGQGSTLAHRLGLSAGDPIDPRVVLFDRLDTWRRRAENPMTSLELARAARVAVRTCEGYLADG